MRPPHRVALMASALSLAAVTLAPAHAQSATAFPDAQASDPVALGPTGCTSRIR